MASQALWGLRILALDHAVESAAIDVISETTAAFVCQSDVLLDAGFRAILPCEAHRSTVCQLCFEVVPVFFED